MKKNTNSGYLFITTIIVYGIVLFPMNPLFSAGEYDELYYDNYASNLLNRHLNRKYTEKKLETDERIRQLENRIVENQKTIEGLIDEKNRLKQSSAKALAECQADLRRISSELEELKKKKAEDDRLADLRIKDLEKQIVTIREKTDNREKAILDEKKQSDERYLNEIDRLKKELESTRSNAALEKDAIISGYEKRVSDLMKKVGEYEKQISSLTARNKELADKLEQEQRISRERQKQLDKLGEQQKSLEEKLASEIEKGEIRLKRFRDRLVINMDNKILFDTGSAELRSSQIRRTLDEISNILASYSDSRVVVEGHTDDVPIHNARFRDNWQLSTERALAVLAHILKNQELNPTRFTAAGASEFRPLVPNTSEKNRALNRRVDIVVYPEIQE